MADYDYKQAIREDILEYAATDGYNPDLLDAVNEDDRDALYELLYDELFVSDSVTGNASGSYTMSREEAERYIIDNIDAQEYFENAVSEFDISADELAEHFFAWEWIDVIIRCSLLGEVLNDIIYGETEEDKADYEKLVASIREEYEEEESESEPSSTD